MDKRLGSVDYDALIVWLFKLDRSPYVMKTSVGFPTVSGQFDRDAVGFSLLSYFILKLR